MKTYRLLMIASLLVTQSALALTPAEIAAFKQQSEAQATIESAKDKIERENLIHEIDLLLLDLQKKQQSMAMDKRIERVSIVMSAGLAGVLGYSVFKPIGAAEGNAVIDLGERWVVGALTSVGLATSLGTGGVTSFLIDVNPQQIAVLRTKLLTAKSRLEAAERE